ncbi:MAG: sensor histidine kinase [Bacteroidota bacterium]
MDTKIVLYIKKIVSAWVGGYFCDMKSLLQINIKALIMGGLITLGLATLLVEVGLIMDSPGEISKPIYIIGNTLIFILCWLIISFLIQKFSVYEVLGVVGLLAAISASDYYINPRYNPITIPLIILFWLGVAYLLLNQFFKKYQTYIFLVYGLVISYYFVDFALTPNYTSTDRARFISFMVAPIPVFAVLWGYEQWRWLKTLQAEKANAELALLKSQINPHFFFNTLNNLYGLVIQKSNRAPEVILKLSDMMRYTIYEGKEDEVPLKNEISYLENYIELHKIRFQKKVDIRFTHDVGVDLKVAPLLFIILLENAFKHGVEKMRENAFIHLQMQTQGKQLFFTIENNFEESTSTHKPGIGLDNLKQRLAFLYPNQHELIIEKNESTYKVLLNLELI